MDYSVIQVGVWEETSLKWGPAGRVYTRNEERRKKTRTEGNCENKEGNRDAEEESV